MALQGDFELHLDLISRLGTLSKKVKTLDDLKGLQGLIIPGGESTTLSKLLISSNLVHEILEGYRNGLNLFGTCAGAIILAKSVLNKKPDQVSLGLLDIALTRNAYGSQLFSHYDYVRVKRNAEKYNVAFIRAPEIREVGPGVEIIATRESDGKIACVKEGNVLAATFHPEITGCEFFHKLFIDMIKES